MFIDWRNKHNQWFKNWLAQSGYPQYWNTMCCAVWDENYYFNMYAKRSTHKRCEEIIDNFERCANNQIDNFKLLGLNVEEEINKLNQMKRNIKEIVNVNKN